jgi:hypothetical protein
MKNKTKLFQILFFSIIFGITQAYLIKEDFLLQAISSSLIPLIISLGIGFVIGIFKSIAYKESFLKNYISVVYMVFIPLIIILSIVLFVGSDPFGVNEK